MSNRRKRRMSSERRLAEISKRTPVTIWAIIAVMLIALAVGLVRTIG